MIGNSQADALAAENGYDTSSISSSTLSFLPGFCQTFVILITLYGGTHHVIRVMKMCFPTDPDRKKTLKKVPEQKWDHVVA